MAAAWRHRPTAHPPPTAHRPSPRSAGAPPSPGTGEWSGDGLWRDDGSRATGHHATQRNCRNLDRGKKEDRAPRPSGQEGDARRPSTNHHACAEIPRHSIRPGRPCISDSVTMIDLLLIDGGSLCKALSPQVRTPPFVDPCMAFQLIPRSAMARKLARKGGGPSIHHVFMCGAAVLYLLELNPQSSMCSHVWLRAYQRNISS